MGEHAVHSLWIYFRMASGAKRPVVARYVCPALCLSSAGCSFNRRWRSQLGSMHGNSRELMGLKPPRHVVVTCKYVRATFFFGCLCLVAALLGVRWGRAICDSHHDSPH